MPSGKEFFSLIESQGGFYESDGEVGKQVKNTAFFIDGILFTRGDIFIEMKDRVGNDYDFSIGFEHLIDEVCQFIITDQEYSPPDAIELKEQTLKTLKDAIAKIEAVEIKS